MADTTPPTAARVREIQKLAEKATQGRWLARPLSPQTLHADEHCWQVVYVENGQPLRVAIFAGWDNHEADAKFAAACDPPTISALCAALLEAQGREEKLREALKKVEAKRRSEDGRAVMTEVQWAGVDSYNLALTEALEILGEVLEGGETK